MFFWMCPFYYICLLWVDHEGVVFLLRQKCLDFKRKASRHRNEYLEYTCSPERCMDFSFVLLLYFQKDVTNMHVKEGCHLLILVHRIVNLFIALAQ